MVDEGKGVGPLKNGVYLDFADAIGRVGADAIKERYDNLFEMYERITDEDPYKVPMRIYPAVHYTMGGLWVDYNLMSNVPGLFVLGEANFSDHGANRLGASALMQGLADGYFVIRYTIANYLADHARHGAGPGRRPRLRRGAAGDVDDRVKRFLSIGGTQSVDHFHRELGKIMWDYCGMARNRTGPREGARPRSPRCARSSGRTSACSATARMNQSLEKAGRVADFFELGELMVPRRARPARSPAAATSARRTRPTRARRCATTTTSPTSRAWEWGGATRHSPRSTRNRCTFDNVHLAQRSYK